MRETGTPPGSLGNASGGAPSLFRPLSFPHHNECKPASKKCLREYSFEKIQFIKRELLSIPASGTLLAESEF